jgi:DNA-binding response OmpR family regulator
MSTEHQQTILIVDDDTDLVEMLGAYLNVQGYTVYATSMGEQALPMASEQQPDLVLLDIHLPDLDGFEVCNQLQASHKTRHIPIIFLTEMRERPDKLHGLQLGVVDYITKPFDVQELRLRVRNTLRRVASAGTENPVTGLPEAAQVDEVLAKIVAGVCPDCGLLAIALLGLETFRELYGFVASDDVLRVTSLTTTTAAREVGGSSTFCGHLDEHTFLIIVPADKMDGLIQRITDRLGKLLEYFYPGDNRAPNARTDDRLRLRMSTLDASSGSLTDVAGLKEQLLAGEGDSGLAG